MSTTSGPAWAQAPGVRMEGSWRSPGYRSARLRARAAYISFGLMLLTVVVLAGLHAIQTGLIEQVIRGDIPSESDLLASDENVRVASGWYLIFWVASAVAFLCWLSRSVENSPPLGAGTPVRSPRESIGWWFVPFASLLIPYQIVRDLYERLATPQRDGKGGLVLGWWILFIGGAVVAVAARAASSPDATAEQLLTASQMTILSDVVDAIGIGFALWLIHELQARADLRAIVLGLGIGVAAPAVWPVGSPMPQRSLAPPASAGVPAGEGRTTIVAFCPGCGQPRLPDARFCAGCGRDLAALGTVAGGAQALDA